MTSRILIKSDLSMPAIKECVKWIHSAGRGGNSLAQEMVWAPFHQTSLARMFDWKAPQNAPKLVLIESRADSRYR